MARKKAGDDKVAIGNIIDVSGEVSIAGGDIYKGYTAEQVSVLLTQITSTFQPKPFDGRCPYKGLDVFEEEDAELFFGREQLVDDLISRVKESRAVFVTGPSGCGKSSLVRAGLLHALKQGGIKNSERWLSETMKPGRDPIGELGRVASSLAGSTNAEDEIRAKAMGDATIFTRWCEIALKEGRDKRAVLFIDQFEEVFTQISNEAERMAFLNLLTHAATFENGRAIVLFSMRSDFVSNCAIYSQINGLLNQQFLQIGAMQPNELVSAIAQPALRVGLRIDPDLVAQIINDMHGEPGALPLMQFALEDLFESQKGKGGVLALTRKDYIDRGGIHKALERHADKMFEKFNTEEQTMARSVFSRLIEVGRGTQDTRRTALFNELVPANTKAGKVKSVLQKLEDARLVTTEENSNKYTITHEKLISAWSWLKKLVDENREAIKIQNEIISDAKEWDEDEEHKRDSSFLYRGARLVNAQEKLKAKQIVLSGLAMEFIKAAEKFYTDELEQEKKRADHLEELNRTALARQLAAQAHSIVATRNSKQMIAVLLATQSMKMFPSIEAAQILLDNNYSARSMAYMKHDDVVASLVFSPDGRYVVSGCYDNAARVWEATSGKEIARMMNGGFVYSVAFSSDGRYVVSGSDDDTARVWEATTGREVARMMNGGFVFSVAFSSDGRYVVSGSNDFTVRVWEATTGREVARMNHHEGVTSVAFSPDGKYVVSGGAEDISVRVWEAATGREVARMTHDGAVNVVAFSPDGNYVVSGSNDSTARVWEAATGREVARMTHDGAVNVVAFSPDGNYVVSGSNDSTARVWEATTGREVARMTHYKRVSSVAFSSDGRYVVSGSNDSTARVWEAATGREVARMTHDGAVNVVAFSPNGRYVVSASVDGNARIWQATPGREVARMTHDGAARVVAFSPEGRYVVTYSANTVLVWEAATGREVARMTHDHWLKSVSYSPEGRYVVTYSANTVLVWEAATGREVARMINDRKMHFIVFSPDGKYIASGSDDWIARVWEATTGKEVAHMTHDHWLNSVSFSPNGKYMVSGSADKTARVWEITSGREVARMIHDKRVARVAFSSDGRYVVSGSDDCTARVWEATSGREVARITHGTGVHHVAFSPDGRYVISGSPSTARIWDATSGREVAHMTHDLEMHFIAFSPDGRYVVGHSSNTTDIWETTSGREVAHMTHDEVVNSLKFSPNGKHLVSGSNDGTARVWEATTGREVARMTHYDRVSSVAFSLDSKYVVSGSEDKTARIWVWQPQDLIARACEYLPRNLTRAEWNQYIGEDFPYQAVCPNLPIEPESTPTA